MLVHALALVQGALPNPLEDRPRGAATMNTLHTPKSNGGASLSVSDSTPAEQIFVDSFSEQVCGWVWVWVCGWVSVWMKVSEAMHFRILSSPSNIYCEMVETGACVQCSACGPRFVCRHTQQVLLMHPPSMLPVIL